MSIEQRENFRGLYTNVAETKAPPSTLRIADNVVVRKPGALEQRQGFDYSAKYSEGEVGVDQDWLNTINYADEVIYESSTRFWSKLRGYVVDWVDLPAFGAVPPKRFRKDSFASSVMRGNLYIPMAEGVMRWPLSDDQQMELSGQHSSRVGLSQTSFSLATNNALANGFQWAYRAVLKCTDKNGLITRSRPTGAFAFQNTLGTAGACRIVVSCVPRPREGEVVELYRGRQFPNSVSPDDEMALVKTFSRDDIPVTSAVYIDDLPDNKRGAALYTSPSQLGMVAASDCPPAAAFSETYRGCLFLGNVRGPARIVLSWNSAPGVNAPVSGETGNGTRTVSFNTTAGSAQVTGITPIAGVRVGQALSGYGTIKTLVGSTATLVNFDGTPQLASTTGLVTNVSCIDAAWIKGPKRGNLDGAYDWCFAYYPYFIIGGQLYLTPTALFFVTPPEPTYRYTAVIESVHRAPLSLELGASHGEEMSPPIAAPFSAKGTAFDQDVLPYGLVWSEPDQPENFPSVNYALIGDRTKHILGLCATRDALFVFKEDGIWRLSGYGGQWSIDAFDLTTFCVLPSSIKKLNNRIFMLSNKGVVAIDDTNGVVVISTPIADQVKRLVDNARSNWARDGYYSLTGVPGVAATVDDRNSEYLLLAGTTPLDLGDGQGLTLVYNEASDAWTTFSFSPVGTRGITPLGLSVTKTGDPCVLTRGDRRSPTYTRSLVDGEVTPELHDGVVLAAPFPDFTAPTPTTANVRFGLAYTADLGRDFVQTGDTPLYPIVGQPAQDILTLDTSSGAWPGTNYATRIYRGVRATVQPHGWVNGPANSKRWKSIIVAFSRFLGPSSLRVLFSGAEQLTVESVQSTTQDFTLARALGMARYHLGSLLRQVVPTAHKRSWLVRARLSWVSVFGNVSLEAIGLDAEQTSTDRPQTDAA